MKKTLPRFTAIVCAIVSLYSCRAADVPISGLPAIGTVQSATIVPVVDVAGTPATKKATVAQLITGLPAATTGADGKMSAADKTKLDAATDANTASAIVRRDASGNFAANVVTASAVTGLSAPVNATDAATKGYVDAAAAGLIIKTPARAATTSAIGNITLSGGAPTTLDGVTLNTNDRVLVKDQSDATENGIYYVQTLGSGANGTWARTTDADTGAELVTGSYIFITGGTVNVQSSWTMVTPGTITIGTSLITWNLFSQTTQILASNIIGQIVGSQVQDAAINTAKFAMGITPVELLASLPTTGNFEGRTVFLTTDKKLYRYNGSAFTAAVAAVDLTGQITTTQITDNAITTQKITANAITAAKIEANTITASQIAADTITAGQIAAGAINTSELAANAVNASKIAANTITASQIAANTITAAQIQAGSITADRLTIATLSAITADIGSVTAGSMSGVSLTIGSGTAAVSITTGGLSIASGRVSLTGDGSNPWIKVTGTGGTYGNTFVQMNGSNGSLPAYFQVGESGVASFTAAATGVSVGNNKNFTVLSGSGIVGPGSLKSIPGDGDSINFIFGQYGSAGSQDGYIGIVINGVNKKIPFYSF